MSATRIQAAEVTHEDGASIREGNTGLRCEVVGVGGAHYVGFGHDPADQRVQAQVHDVDTLASAMPVAQSETDS